MKKVSKEEKSHFLRLYQLAMVDDNFSPLEWDMLYEFAAERGVSSTDLNAILLDPVGDLLVPESISERIIYLVDFTKMIWADDKVTHEERTALEKFLICFGVKKDNVTEQANILIDEIRANNSLSNETEKTLSNLIDL